MLAHLAIWLSRRFGSESYADEEEEPGRRLEEEDYPPDDELPGRALLLERAGPGPGCTVPGSRRGW